METKLDKSSRISLSKALSKLLRHTGVSQGLPIQADGCCAIAPLLVKLKATEENIRQIVAEDEKKRYSLIEKDGVLYIRANSGHSIDQIAPETFLKIVKSPAEVGSKRVVHSTRSEVLHLILENGLNRMSRNHIHFYLAETSDDPSANDEFLTKPSLNGTDVFIELDLDLAMKNGYKFFVQENYLLCPGVFDVIPPLYFKNVYRKIDKKLSLIFSNKDLGVLLDRYQPKFLFVLDFEANCVKGERLEPAEIVEFPVVPISAKSNTILDKQIFHQYVNPTVHSLQPFTTELCGITLEMLKGAKSLDSVLNDFENFLKSNQFSPDEFVFVTCGDFDLRGCLKREAKFKNMDVKPYLKRYINLKEVFEIGLLGRGVNNGSKTFQTDTSMEDMLEKLGLKLDGRHHSGIDDSKNLAKIVIDLLAKGIFFTNNYVKVVKY